LVGRKEGEGLSPFRFWGSGQFIKRKPCTGQGKSPQDKGDLGERGVLAGGALLHFNYLGGKGLAFAGEEVGRKKGDRGKSSGGKGKKKIPSTMGKGKEGG